MAKKKQNPAKRLEYKIAAKSKRERTILWVVAVIICVVVLALIVGIIVYNMIHDGDEIDKTYADHLAESEEEVTRNNRVVALCNNIEVPYEALRFHTLLQKRALEAKYGEGIWDKASTAEPHRAELEAAVVKSLQADYMILSVCLKLGVNTEQEAVITQVNQKVNALWKQTEADFKAGTGDAKNYASAEEMYRAALEELGMSENQLRTYYKIQDCLPQLIFYAMEEFGHFTYVLGNIDEFEDYVHGDTNGTANFVRTIQVLTEDQETAQSVYETLNAIDDPVARRTKMEDYIGSSINKDVSNVTRDGYYFTRGEMVENYEKAAFSLGMDEVSTPVEVPGGWCVMMRLTMDNSYVTTNIAELLKNYQNTIMDTYVEGFRDDCTVDYTSYGDGIDLVAMH